MLSYLQIILSIEQNGPVILHTYTGCIAIIDQHECFINYTLYEKGFQIKFVLFLRERLMRIARFV